MAFNQEAKKIIKKMFYGRDLVVATIHGKEKIVAPILEKHLGVRTILPVGLDTDRFGTFSGEVERPGDQLETARVKALAAIENAGVDLGVASEGSFGPDRESQFVRSNLELILLIDKKNQLEVKGHYRTYQTNSAGSYASTLDEALTLARQIGFPDHGIIVRRSPTDRSKIYKNISSEEELVDAVKQLLRRPFAKKVYIESDMRAHRNPTRTKAIERATEDLVKNIFSLCPRCQSPGFVVVGFEAGLKCSLCGLATELPKNEIYACARCDYSEKRRSSAYGRSADPRYCQFCNP